MIYLVITLIFLSKPLYWTGRIFYGYLKNDLARVEVYTNLLMEWFKGMWDFIRWQKSDL